MTIVNERDRERVCKFSRGRERGEKSVEKLAKMMTRPWDGIGYCGGDDAVDDNIIYSCLLGTLLQITYITHTHLRAHTHAHKHMRNVVVDHRFWMLCIIEWQHIRTEHRSNNTQFSFYELWLDVCNACRRASALCHSRSFKPNQMNFHSWSAPS